MKGKFTIWDVVKVFVAILLLTIFGEMIFMQIPYFAEMGPVGGVDFIIVYLVQSIIILLPLLLVVKEKNIKIRELGFKKVGIKKILGLAALGYFAYFSIMLVILQITSSLNLEIPGFGQQESHMEFIGGNNVAATIVILVITFLAPVIEEVFFRGFVFKAMIGKCPKWIAFVISAAIFAAFHFEFQVFMPLFLLGLILNWMFFKSKSLYPGIAFHIINNVIALSLEYYVYANPEVLEMVQGFIRF